MKNIFSYNSKLMRALAALADVFTVNILFIVCCIPVITFGAARAALHTVCTQWIKNEDAGARDFLRAFKTNFFAATALWLTMLPIGLLLVLAFYNLWNSTLDNKNTLMIIEAVPAIVYLFSLSRIFEIVSWFECRYVQYLRNSILISIAHPISTVLHIVLLVLPLAAFFLRPDIFTMIGLGWVLAYFSIEGLIDAFLSKKTYNRLIKKNTPETK